MSHRPPSIIASRLIYGGAVLFAVATIGVVLVRSAPVRAAVPNRLYGAVTLNGQPAAPGTPIVALTAGKTCASGQVVAPQPPNNYAYILDVPDANAAQECKPGAVITFTVGGQTAGQTFTLSDIGDFARLDLVAPGTPNVPVTASATAIPISATRTVNLGMGCSDVPSPFADSTKPETIAAAITPGTALDGIWRYDTPAQTYRAFNPNAPTISDLTTVNKNDPLRICMNAPATITVPA